MLVDIGVNLTHRSFAHDREAIIARAVAAGVRALVITGTSLEASRQALALARDRPGLSATCGIHPHEARHVDDAALTALAALAAAPECVAVGECGLDFDRDFSPRPAQERAFAAQLELAARLGKPLFLHERAAHRRFVEILGAVRARLGPVVVHCFTGSSDELDTYLSMDLHIGITGWICDERRGLHLREAIRRIPLDRLMLETDGPFLVPRTLRPRPTRNEPAYLTEVLATVADALGQKPTIVARATTETARRFFGPPVGELP